MDKELERDFEQLINWSTSLATSVKTTLPLVKDILQSNKPLPARCPSRGSLATMQFRDIEKNLFEVEAFCTKIREQLLSKYK